MIIIKSYVVVEDLSALTENQYIIIMIVKFLEKICFLNKKTLKFSIKYIPLLLIGVNIVCNTLFNEMHETECCKYDFYNFDDLLCLPCKC